MFTARQLDRLWNQRRYADISSICLEMRSECSPTLMKELDTAEAAAALGLIRLDEMNQPAHPLATPFLRRVLLAQTPDGGFGSPVLSALCLRALLAFNGDGIAIHRGLTHLAGLQREDGLWPRIASRRMPSDALVSAFILHNLAQFPRFRSAVRFEQAMAQLASLSYAHDDDARHLTRLLHLRHSHSHSTN